MADLGNIGALASVGIGGEPSAGPTGGAAFTAPARTVIQVSASLLQAVPPAPGAAGERFTSKVFSTRFPTS